MKQHYETLADHHAELSEWFGRIGDWYDVMSWRQADAAFFRQIEGQYFEIAKVYRLMANEEEKREDMKRTILTSVMLVVTLVFLLAVMPAGAQENPSPLTPLPQGEGSNAAAILPVVATVDGLPVEATLVAPGGEQPPVVVVENPQSSQMFWIFSAVIFALLAALVLVFRPLIIKLADSAPAWAVEAAFNAGSTLLQSAQDYASTTPSAIDDDLVAELRKEIELLKAQIGQGKPDTSTSLGMRRSFFDPPPEDRPGIGVG